LATRYTSVLPVGSANSTRQAPPSRQAPSDLPVVALGRLEPEGGVIQIGGPPGDRLSRILVKEGEEVEEGQELVYLQSYSDRLAEKHLADSQLQEAIARRQALKESGELLVEQARINIAKLNKEHPFAVQAMEAKVRLLKVQMETANKEMARLKASGPDVASPQQLNLQHFAVRQAEEELTAAQASLGKLQTEQPLNLQAAQTQLRIAEADLARSQLEGPIDALKQAVAVAQAHFEHAVLRAPRAGKVLKVMGHPGEICAGPILQLGNVREMLVITEVYETDRGRLQEGCKATITSPALPHELTGTVRSIGRVVAKNKIFDLNPMADADRRVMEVKVLLDTNASAADYIQMQVTVTIAPEKARPQ
jgi:HlyD family secretion protein